MRRRNSDKFSSAWPLLCGLVCCLLCYLLCCNPHMGCWSPPWGASGCPPRKTEIRRTCVNRKQCGNWDQHQRPGTIKANYWLRRAWFTWETLFDSWKGGEAAWGLGIVKQELRIEFGNSFIGSTYGYIKIQVVDLKCFHSVSLFSTARQHPHGRNELSSLHHFLSLEHLCQVDAISYQHSQRK